MGLYKQYMQSIAEEIRQNYMMGDEEYFIYLMESMIASFDVLPEQVLRQIRMICGEF